MPLLKIDEGRKGGSAKMTEKQKGSHTFFSGVLVLTIANLITKVVGLIFKIPLTNMLGDEGMGYFNTAYQIYTWLYMISTAGLPVALSLMISERNAQNKQREIGKLFKMTAVFFGAVGLIGSLLMLVFCKSIARFISADLSYLCILSIAPALFFVCISSTVRGYFQGHRNMLPTAVSEIIESVGKMSIGIALGYYALKHGYPIYKVAAYAIFGVTAGVTAGALFLGISAVFSGVLRKNETQVPISDVPPQSAKNLFSSLIKIAVPIMLSSSLLSMSSMLDTLIVIRRLVATGLTNSAAVALYGNYTAYCVTLFNLPPVLIYPIVNTLIPSISEARASDNAERVRLLMHKSLKLAAVISLPCAFGLSVMSGPILKLIFSNKASAEMAAPLLSVLAPSVLLIGIMAVTNGVLQACKLQKYSVISMLFGAAVKGVSAYLLVGVKFGDTRLYMYASPISTFLFYFTITVLNVFFIVKHTGLSFPTFSIFMPPFAASILCALSAYAANGLLGRIIPSSDIVTLLAIAIAAAVYAVLLLLLGGITKSDVSLVPKAEKLINRLPIIRKMIKEE